MNIIRFENIDRIRIRIFWYSNIIRIIFEYRIIRSPLKWVDWTDFDWMDPAEKPSPHRAPAVLKILLILLK